MAFKLNNITNKIRKGSKSLGKEFSPILNTYASAKVVDVIESQNNKLSGDLNGRKPLDSKAMLDYMVYGNSNVENTYLNVRNNAVNNYAVGSFENLVNDTNNDLSNKIGADASNSILNFLIPYAENINLPFLGNLSSIRDRLEPDHLPGRFLADIEPPYPDFFYISLIGSSVLNFVLPVNPTEMNFTYAEKNKETSENIGGHIESNFTDGFDTVRMEGVTGGFKDDEHGFSSYFRENSQNYKTYKEFLRLFESNNDIYIDGDIASSSYVLINFIGFSLKGKFINISITEDEENPFMFNISFEFKIYDTVMDV